MGAGGEAAQAVAAEAAAEAGRRQQHAIRARGGDGVSRDGDSGAAGTVLYSCTKVLSTPTAARAAQGRQRQRRNLVNSSVRGSAHRCLMTSLKPAALPVSGSRVVYSMHDQETLACGNDPPLSAAGNQMDLRLMPCLMEMADASHAVMACWPGPWPMGACHELGCETERDEIAKRVGRAVHCIDLI